MSPKIVRGFDESVKARLAAQTQEHGRSMDAEVRVTLTRAAGNPHDGRNDQPRECCMSDAA